VRYGKGVNHVINTQAASRLHHFAFDLPDRRLLKTEKRARRWRKQRWLGRQFQHFDICTRFFSR
jgi:hypothetical protein